MKDKTPMDLIPEKKPAPKKEPAKVVGYVYRTNGNFGKSGGRKVEFKAGQEVEGMGSNEIMHLLSNGIIEPRKG